jgi:hypothetical protein
MKRFIQKKHLIIISLLALLIVAAGILALTNPGIPRHFTGAGGESSGGGYVLNGSIGQHDAGPTLSGGEYILAGGFWGAGGAIIYPVYLPLVLR